MVNQRLDLRILQDKAWLIAKRERMTREALAEELQCFAGSIRWAERALTDDQKQNFVYDRQHKKPETI